ncbi:MAG: insulinase family protein [Alphaproteobacteria bacterium]|nr:insulinase family protein [Alphaproteobacteria bacterium]
MNVEITKLPNGMTIVTDPMPQLQSAAVGVWVNCGGRNETLAQMGLSHMLEHMAFKGTERRNARQIAEEMESVGAYLNAYTSREQTAFHARALKGDVPLAVDVLADILINPTFEPLELERERGVILQEIGQSKDTPDDIVFDHLQSVAYPDQPMGFPILGNEESVNSFGRDDLKNYMGPNYRAGSMAFIASGAVSHADMVALVSEKFAGLKSGSAQNARPARYAGGDLRVEDDLEQVHIAYAFPGVASADPELYAAQVYVAALGGGMSSRLFQEAREKRGLCYSIYSYANAFVDGGIIGIYAGTGEKEAGEISAVIADQMAALAETASEEEVARAKAQMRSSFLMGLERPSARAEQIASQLHAFGRVLGVEEVLAKLEAVDASAVRAFGSRVMNAGDPSLAAVGPVTHVEDRSHFARRFGAAVKAAE